jgi:excisionase family DNA binding protein
MNDKPRETEEPVLAPPAENTDDPAVARQQQIARTQQIRYAMLAHAMRGDVRAVGAILKCDEREADLLKIGEANKKHEYVIRWQGGSDEDGPRKQVWLSPGECAAILGVSVKTISRAAERGELSAIKTNGGHRRIRREDLESYRTATKNSENKSDKSDKSDSVKLEVTENKGTGSPPSREGQLLKIGQIGHFGQIGQPLHAI